MHPIEKILGPIDPMLSELFNSAKNDWINLQPYLIDHVCYRVATLDRYHELKWLISEYGVCIGEHVINGRPIATFLLHEPLRYDSFEIECIELPAPKTGKNYVEWWEHAECSVQMTPIKFMEMYPWIVFGTDSINKTINPEIERRYMNYVLKFHEHTLRYVVEVLEV